MNHKGMTPNSNKAIEHLEARFADHRRPMMHEPLALSSVHDALVTYHTLLHIRSLSGSTIWAGILEVLHKACC